ncbi:MAG: transposase [Planctomycetaceae bacterium]|nr:transposase [Planctomycetaceae bacterium]
MRDRKTFQDFLGITVYHTIPDAKTIWLFAEQMKNAHLDEALFDKFLEMLESKGIKPKCVKKFPPIAFFFDRI